MTYSIMNQMSLCPIYCNRSFVPEFPRLAVTRLRLSSHYLRIETGRWSRLPQENRLCKCGQCQTEEHVLLNCKLTESLRSKGSLIGTRYRNITD